MHLLPFLALAACISLRGESEIRMKGIENRMDQLEKSSNHPLQTITPCAGPKVTNGMDINLQGDFIYWTARLDSLTYAKTGLGDLSSSTSTSKGEVQSVDWAWDPGFKVGIGWNFGHGCWDMQLQYTWLYTNVNGSKNSEFLQPGFEIRSPIFQSLDIPYFSRAHAQFDLHYQVGDLELGRNYYISKTLKLRPFVGLKGTWQKQDYRVFYESLSLLSDTYNYNASFDQSIWGLGARIGLSTSWQFSKNFSFYGNLALTGMWLHYDTNRKDLYSEVVQGSTVATADLQERLNLIKPVLEFALGLRAETFFSNSRYHILLQAGWESQIWINQTLYISLNDHYDRFDLSLQGLTAKLRFDF